MSKNYEYEGSSQFKPISPWGYVGYGLLFSLPVAGLIILIIFSFSKDNINRRNYARSYWCWMLVIIILGIILLVSGVPFFKNLLRALS